MHGKKLERHAFEGLKFHSSEKSWIPMMIGNEGQLKHYTVVRKRIRSKKDFRTSIRVEEAMGKQCANHPNYFVLDDEDEIVKIRTNVDSIFIVHRVPDSVYLVYRIT